MCNLYNVSKSPQTILEFTRAMINHAGILQPGNVFPDYAAPIVRPGENGERELTPLYDCEEEVAPQPPPLAVSITISSPGFRATPLANVSRSKTPLVLATVSPFRPPLSPPFAPQTGCRARL